MAQKTAQKALASKLVSNAQQKDFTNFKKTCENALNEKLAEKMEQRKQELAQSLVKKNNQQLKENYRGRNIIDHLKRLADLDGKGYPPIDDEMVTLDDGDKMFVDSDSAKKMVDLFNRYPENEQFRMQERMRANRQEFQNVMASAGVVSAGYTG